MLSYIVLENSLKAYLEKQKCFRELVKDVQKSLQGKKFKQTNYSFEEYIKMKWNISKAQAYRYLISAKVIDQLEDFYILPCYERICRSLYNCAKTPKQMKLLWGSILKTAGNRPDSINSSHVKKMWKKLCDDEKYNNICHYEDEIMNKVGKSLNIDLKPVQINTKDVNNNNNNNTPSQCYPSPTLNVPVVSSSNNINNTNKMNNYCNTPYSQVEYQTISVNTNSNPQQTVYPSPIQNDTYVQINKSIPCTFSSPSVISNPTIFNNGNIEQFNTNAVTLSTINVIECPVYEVQVPSTLPSRISSQVPSTYPSQISSQIPSILPSQISSQIPSTLPSQISSQIPSTLPSQISSQIPSTLPSQISSQIPSTLPTQQINNTQYTEVYSNYQQQPQQIMYYY